MAYEPAKWAPGLLFVGTLWVLAVLSETGAVEHDLAERAKAAVGQDSLANPEISVAGRDVTIAGAAFAPDATGKIVDAALGASGVRLVNIDGLTVIPEAKPYVWSATKDGAKIALAGSVPNPVLRAAVGAAAKAVPGGTVADGMDYKRGDTAALGANAAFALDELAHFSKGSATISDGALTLVGVASDAKNYEAALAALKSAPAGLRIASSKIDKSPADIAASSAAKKAAEEAAAKKAAEAAAAKKAADEAAAKKAAEEAAAKKAAEEAAAKKAAEEAAAKKAADEAAAKKVADEAAAKKAAEEAAAKKTADEAAAKKAAEEALAKKAAAPASIEDIATAAAALAAQGPKLNVPSCDEGLRSELATGAIEFDTGKATVSSKSYAMLVKLAGVALRCEVSEIEVSGHTDNEGDAVLNMSLSKARAQAVVAILVKAGIPEDKIKAEGFGADKPVASNDTGEGRAKNRRIEFAVR